MPGEYESLDFGDEANSVVMRSSTAYVFVF